MVTGLECAGLALGVIPIFIEGLKVYGRGVGSLRDVIQPRRLDAALEEFNEDPWYEMFLFREHVEIVTNNLLNLDDARKASVIHNCQKSEWKTDSDVAQSFGFQFSGKHEFHAFEIAVKGFIRMAGQLIQDRGDGRVWNLEAVRHPPWPKSRILTVFPRHRQSIECIPA